MGVSGDRHAREHPSSEIAPFGENLDGRFLAAYLGIPVIRLRLLELLRRHGEMTASRLATTLGWTSGGIRPHLEVLEDLGIVDHTVKKLPEICRPTACYRLDPQRADQVGRLVLEAIAARGAEGPSPRALHTPEASPSLGIRAQALIARP